MRQTGWCRLCGAFGRLTEEHLPAKKAFNDASYITLKLAECASLGPDDEILGERRQGGIRTLSFCEKCNNNTGSWYAPGYIEWAKQGMRHLLDSNGAPGSRSGFRILPLSVIKQIVSMFFAVNPEGLGVENEYLRRFVLGKYERGLPPGYRIYACYMTGPKLRHSPRGAKGSFDSYSFDVYSEVCTIPFGYVMAFDSPAPDRRLADITHFATCPYGKEKTVELPLQVLPVHLPSLACDYRTRGEILTDYQRNLTAPPTRVDAYSEDQIGEIKRTIARAAQGIMGH